MPYGKDNDIYIDISSINYLYQTIEEELSGEKLELVMHRVLDRASQSAGTIIKRESAKEYEVTQTFVGQHIGKPHFSYSNARGLNGISCVIPIRGKRSALGSKGGKMGGHFPARGGRRGWETLARLKNGDMRKRYKIGVKVLKGTYNYLPNTRDSNKLLHYTNNHNAPFRNLSADSLHNAVFIRVGKKRLPIVPVKGIAVPQMPLNKAKDAIQDKVIKVMHTRMIHEYDNVIKGIAQKTRSHNR